MGSSMELPFYNDEAQMKFSSSTIDILKNFSEINTGIHFKEGNALSTYHPQKFVLAEASIGELLPRTFAIYDLNKFLSVTSLFNEPDFEFEEGRVVVKKENLSVNYVYAQPDLILDPGNKPSKYRQRTIDGKVATATIERDDLKALKQAATVLQLPDIEVVAKNGELKLTAKDSSSSASDSFEVIVKADIAEEVNQIIKCKHLTLLDGNYDIVLHPSLAYFKNQKTPVEYWVAYFAQ